MSKHDDTILKRSAIKWIYDVTSTIVHIYICYGVTEELVMYITIHIVVWRNVESLEEMFSRYW